MKGYVFNLDKKTDPLQILQKGEFVVRKPKGKKRPTSWSSAMLATFADFTTIVPHELVFFFKERRIYGVARIRKIRGHARVGAWWTWPKAADVLAKLPPGIEGPVAILFEPMPHIYPDGIDMDELLGDARAGSDWALRFFWSTSFIQMDDDETRALLAAFVRRFSNKTPIPALPRRKKLPARMGPFQIGDLIARRPSYVKKNGAIGSENLLHGLLIERLRRRPSAMASSKGPGLVNAGIFHEVAASPPKPADYADWLDILRVRAWMTSPERLPHAWDVIECKKASFDSLGDPEAVLSQLLKYVDFCARAKASRDYGTVHAHYVAHAKATRFLQRYRALVRHGTLSRTYVLDPHEASPLHSWNNLYLWSYSWNPTTRALDVKLLDPVVR